MTYHDNDLYLKPDAGYTLISGFYKIDSFFVSNGQDPDGHIYSGLQVDMSSDGRLTFNIGRKGRSDTADWFNARVPASKNTFNQEAGKLNFAFIGTLQMTLTGGILGGGRRPLLFPMWL